MLEILPFNGDVDASFRKPTNLKGTIHVSGATLETLRETSVEALRSLARRGLEVGGILLGTTEEPAQVTSLLPVFSEHLYGPRYRLSERDLTLLEAELERLRQQQTGTNFPVGLYRTCTQGDDSSGAQDRELLTRLFPEGNSVFLLVGPKLTGRAAVSCYYWDREELKLCPHAEERAERKQPEAIRIPDPPARATLPDAGRAADTSRHSKLAARLQENTRHKAVDQVQRALLAGAAALLAFTVIFLSQHRPASAVVTPPASAPVSQLESRLQSTRDGVELRWNAGSDLAQHATGALLSVEEGGNQTELALSPAELQTGIYFYGPASRGAKFLITVFTGDDAEIQARMVMH